MDYENKITTPPLQLVLYFTTLFVLLTTSVIGQTTYQLNGRTLHLQNNNYFFISNSDTVYVDTDYITVVFKPGFETTGYNKVVNDLNYSYMGISSNKYYVFKLHTNTAYYTQVTQLNTLPETDKTLLSVKGKSLTSTQCPNDPAYNCKPPSWVPCFDETSYYAWYLGIPEDDVDCDEYFRTNEKFRFLDMRSAWSITTGDNSVKVGILDSGNDWLQPDFPPDNYIGKNFFTGTTNTNSSTSSFSNSHGTLMNSIICSRSNNNLGIFGIAGGWNNNNYITPVHYLIMDDGSVPLAYVPLAIQQAADDGCKVINMSFGYPGLDPSQNLTEIEAVVQAIDDAIADHDVIFIAGTGNYGKNYNIFPSNVFFPANYEPVIAVGGALRDNKRALLGSTYYPDWASCYGDGIDLVTSWEAYTNFGKFNTADPYQIVGGTSISIALLSGVVALMYSANPCLTRQEVLDILKATCYKNTEDYTFNNNGWNMEVGYGFPNAYKAVLEAKGKATYTVSGNETWTSNRTYRGDIIIPPTCSLTLNGITLKMGPEAGIIVQQGGRLETNNSVLTALCDSTWKGITVQGYPNLPQYPYTNQGQAFLYNSTVEYARIALHSPDGGRINSTNSKYLNNTLSVLCNAYSYQNNSNFNTCTFKNNLLHREPLKVRAMVKLLQNTGATFTQCQFLNELTAATPSGFGIYSAFSDFTVDGGCHSLQIPCSDEQSIPSVFDRFSYGIYAMLSPGGIKVEHGLFTNNNCGIYASNSQNVKIWKSSFQIPSDQDPDPRGAYINSCSGFHIEGNTFNCSAATHADEAGLYLLNTGPTQNYVYNNTFTNLLRGSVADGENRHATLATGLCYKCNDFSNNAYDIDVIRDQELELASNHGINLYQGLPSAGNPSSNKDTLAASNTFSLSPYQYNIHNINNPSNYYYQEFTTPANVKIVPDPVLGINNFQNIGTNYSKSLVCKSWINSGGSIGQDQAAKSMANSNAGAADLQVQNTVDGGNTTNLTFDILGSMPSEALELRNQLVDESPYLSDTVMKSAIEQENVLPNAMVRDILIENPQAAKSGEIMDMLDERYEPMPAYMKEEIEAGKQIVGGREQLEAKRDGWLQQESFLTNRIVSSYLSDTVNPNAINELKAFLQNENTVPSGFVLADICLQRGDYAAAAQAINTLQTNFSLSPAESQQAADYLALNSILAGFQADTIALSEVDSTHAIPLFTLYQSGDNNATAMARDILIASGLLLYQEPITIGDNEKSAIAQLPAAKPAATTKRSSDHLSIFPNPATTYTIVEYSLPANAINASISIYNAQGVEVWLQDVKRAKDQVIIDLSNIPSGSYRVALQSGNQTLTSKSLSVSK